MLLRIYDAAGGNPFFALELARAAAEAAERDDVLAIPESPEIVRIRLAALPDETRAALLVVAALGQPQTTVVSAAVKEWEDAVAPAIEARPRARRRSGPLHASAPRLGGLCDASAHRRRNVHRALADVVDEAEQRGRHLALATERPNDRVAAVASAAVAAAARAPETAAELAEHARRLTPRSGPARATRGLDAATYAWSAGDANAARRSCSS